MFVSVFVQRKSRHECTLEHMKYGTDISVGIRNGVFSAHKSSKSHDNADDGTIYAIYAKKSLI